MTPNELLNTDIDYQVWLDTLNAALNAEQTAEPEYIKCFQGWTDAEIAELRRYEASLWERIAALKAQNPPRPEMAKPVPFKVNPADPTFCFIRGKW